MKKLLFIAALTLAATTFTTAQKLEAGKTFEREIGSGEKHAYDVQMKKDEAYHLVVEQRGVDVVLRVFAPDGGLAAEMDSPNGITGDESMLFIAPVGGNYRVEISPLDADAAKGKYFVKTAAARAATGAERDEAQLKNDLIKTVRAIDDAFNRGDKAAVVSLVADDYTGTDGGGRVYNKADYLKGVPEPKQTEKTQVNNNYSDVRVRGYDDTAVLSLLDDAVAQIGNQTFKQQLRMTQIYRRSNGKWQLAAAHTTEIKKVQDPPIVKLDAKVLNEYVGQYEVAPGFIINVETDGEKLLTYTNDAKNKQSWYPMGKDMFFNKGGTYRGIFVRAADGKVTETINRSDDGQELKAKKIK